MKCFLVGDKDLFAFEAVLSSDTVFDGRVFMYVRGEQFGQDFFDEDVKLFLFRCLSQPVKYSYNYDPLFSMSSDAFYEYMHSGWNGLDLSGCEQCKSFGYDFGVVSQELVFRAGYAFDRMFIALIPSFDQEKLVVFDDVANRCLDVVLNKGDFYSVLDKLNKGHLRKYKNFVRMNFLS